MNIRKTNPMGVLFLESKDKRFKSDIENSIKELEWKKMDEEASKRTFINDEEEKDFYEKRNGKGILVNTDVFDFCKDYKLFKLTKNIVNNCKLINIDSVKENINVSDFNFNSLVILLDEDSLIKIDRAGSDFHFLYMKDLMNSRSYYFDSYSFLTKEFNIQKEGVEGSVFVIQILTYLYFGDITTKNIPSKSKVKLSSFSKFLNNSKLNITYVDSLWKQRICVDGFKVRGHFRMQPIGEGRKKRKLIWIEEFNKEGYNRKATRELA